MNNLKYEFLTHYNLNLKFTPKFTISKTNNFNKDIKNIFLKSYINLNIID